MIRNTKIKNNGSGRPIPEKEQPNMQLQDVMKALKDLLIEGASISPRFPNKDRDMRALIHTMNKIHIAQILPSTSLQTELFSKASGLYSYEETLRNYSKARFKAHCQFMNKNDETFRAHFFKTHGKADTSEKRDLYDREWNVLMAKSEELKPEKEIWEQQAAPLMNLYETIYEQYKKYYAATNELPETEYAPDMLKKTYAWQGLSSPSAVATQILIFLLSTQKPFAPEIFTPLLEAGADVNAPHENGQTALDLAQGNAAMLKALTEGRAAYLAKKKSAAEAVHAATEFPTRVSGLIADYVYS